MKRIFSLTLASLTLAPLTLASLAVTGEAQAQSVGIATRNLNIRSGPGSEQPLIGRIPTRGSAAILGCVEGSLWCQVEFRGIQGWTYSRYMTLHAGGRRIVVTGPADMRGVPVVAYPSQPGMTRVVETTGAAPDYNDAALIPPLPNLILSLAAAIFPPPVVSSYVTANPGDPIALQGEVVVGAGLPQTVVLNNVPDYRYQYVYVNDTPVLVDPATRRIVYVFR